MKHHSNPQKTATKEPKTRLNRANCGLIYAPRMATLTTYFDAYILLKRNKRLPERAPKEGTPNSCANLLTHDVGIDIAIFRWAKGAGVTIHRTNVNAWTRYEFIYDPITLQTVKEIEALY